MPPKWLFAPTLKHYVELWHSRGVFFDGLLDSLLITAGATLLAIVASTCAGYVYSRNSGAGSGRACSASSSSEAVHVMLTRPRTVTVRDLAILPRSTDL